MNVNYKSSSTLTLAFLPTHNTDIDKCQCIMSRAWFVDVEIFQKSAL